MNIEVSVLQLIAYVALTLASVTVTTVSAIFSYRQNFGWSPLLLSAGYGMSGGRGGPTDAVVYFEVWNRRKYPIVVRNIIVEFENIEIVRGEPEQDDWHNSGDALIQRQNLRLEPAAHHRYEVKQRLKPQSLDAIRGVFEVSLQYTDALSGRGKSLSFRSDYNFIDVAKKPWYMRIIGRG